MAKFCIYCGKPLEEGEVCSCQQAAAKDTAAESASENSTTQAAGTEGTSNNTTGTASNNAGSNAFVEKLKLVFTKFADYFKSPTGTAKEFAAKNDSTYGILMICTNLIVLFLLLLLLINKVSDALDSTLGGRFRMLLGDSSFSIALMFTVIFAAYYFAMAGMLVLTTTAMFKGSMKFSQAVSIVGVNAFINAVIIIVAVILMFVSPTLGLIVLYVGLLYSTLMEYVSYIEMADISSDKKAYALLISLIGVMLAVFLASKIMGSMIATSISNNFKNNLENSSNLFN